jgi:O-antigen ligase
MEAATNFTVVTFPVVLVSILLNKDVRNKILNNLLLSFFVLGLMITMSRSAVMGVFVSTLIIFYILRRRLFYKFLISIVIIIVLFLTIEPLSNTAYFLFRVEEGMSARDHIWKMSMDMIKDYPVFGIGPGAYGYYMYNYFPLMLNDWPSGLLTYLFEVSGGQNISHSLFLVLFTEMGIFGFIVSLALPIIFIRIGLKTINKYKHYSDEKYYLIVALFAGGVSIIIRNIFNSIGIMYVSGIQTDLPFWLIFGSLLYYNYAPLKETSFTK